MWWVPLVAGGVSAIGNMISQHETNRTNVALARETNALSERMHDQDLAFNREMWEKQVSYNDPSNLRKLLSDAGYNPAALVAGGQSALGSAPSASPAAGVPSLTTPRIENPVSVASTIAMQGLNSMADALNKSEEAKGKQIDNEFKAEQLLATINQLQKSGQLSAAQAEQIRQQIAFMDATWNARTREIEQNAYKLNQDAEKAKADKELTDYLRIHKAPKEVEEIVSKIKNLEADGKLKEAQEYATRAGVPYNILALRAAAARDFAQGKLTQLEADMQEPTKEMITKWLDDPGVGGDIKRIIWMILQKFGSK